MEKNNKKLLKLSEYAKLKGISTRTCHRRIADGTLIVKRSKTNRIFVEMDDEKNIEKYVVVYARVSSSENKNNLESQADRLSLYCNAKGWIVKEVVKEIGSGLNDSRKKLLKILNNDKVTHIVVEHKDRLTRFGYNYISNLWDGNIIVINEVENNSEQDLMQDFVSLVTSFCARLYGKRRTKRKTEKLIKELENNNEF